MMIETSDGTRVELLPTPSSSHTTSQAGGVALLDSRDGSLSATFTYSSISVEIGQPVRYLQDGHQHTLPHGEVINTLVWHQAA